jgi:hypothetical protein
MNVSLRSFAFTLAMEVRLTLDKSATRAARLPRSERLRHVRQMVEARGQRERVSLHARCAAFSDRAMGFA